MKKDYLFIVRTKEEINGIPEGSGIYVEKESKKYYFGKWSSMNGTSKARVPKDKCEKLDNI